MNIEHTPLHGDFTSAFHYAGPVDRSLFTLARHFDLFVTHDVGDDSDSFRAVLTTGEGRQTVLRYFPGDDGRQTKMFLPRQQEMIEQAREAAMALLHTSPRVILNPRQAHQRQCIGTINLRTCSLAQRLGQHFTHNRDANLFEMPLPLEGGAQAVFVHAPGDPLNRTRIYVERKINTLEKIRDISYLLLERIHIDDADKLTVALRNGRELALMDGQRPSYASSLERMRQHATEAVQKNTPR